MIGDEIKNKIQLEIINVNKKITNKKRGTDSKEKNKLKGLYDFLHDQHAILGRKRERKKKSFSAIPYRTTIQAASWEEENVETNQMML